MLPPLTEETFTKRGSVSRRQRRKSLSLSHETTVDALLTGSFVMGMQMIRVEIDQRDRNRCHHFPEGPTAMVRFYSCPQRSLAAFSARPSTDSSATFTTDPHTGAVYKRRLCSMEGRAASSPRPSQPACDRRTSAPATSGTGSCCARPAAAPGTSPSAGSGARCRSPSDAARDAAHHRTSWHRGQPAAGPSPPALSHRC